MTSRPASGLEALFEPSSVAVVGASPAGGYGLTTIQNLRSLGYRGSIFPINPGHQQVAGLPCYPTLEAVPEPIDAVAVAVPAARVPAVIDSAAAIGSRVAIVFAGGMGEGAGGVGGEWAALVRSTARSTGLRVLGPNCLGTIEFAGGCALWPVALPTPDAGAERGVALVAQSGNMSLNAVSTGRGVRFSRLASCGNQIDVTAAELIEHLLDREDVTVVAAMLEAVPDVDRFASALAVAAERDVPVVVLRSGHSRLGRIATLAHTGSVTGPDHLMRALLRHHGAVEVRDLDELLATCAVLGAGRRPQGAGLGALSTSGGECALIADLAAEHGVHFPALPSAIAADLGPRLPPFATLANPLDLTGATWGDRAAYQSAAVALSRVPGVDVIVHLGDRPAHAPDDEEAAWPRMLAGLAEAAAQVTQPVVSVATVGEVRAEHVADLEKAGILSLAGLQPALAALGHAARRARTMAAIQRRDHRRPVVDGRRRERALRLLDGRGRVVPEAVAKALVALYGIPAPPGSVVTSATAAEAGARRLGFPVAMKLHGPEVTHKSDLGGVLLGVGDPARARAAFDELQELARRAGLREPSVLVERQIDPGPELIVGGQNHPQFGPVLMAGAGGVLTELLDDTVHRLAPVDGQEALEMVGELRTAAALDGRRGRPGIDLDAVAEAVVAVGDLLTELPEVRELDLNPILPGPGGRGCIAVDALIVLAGGDEEGR